MLCRRELKGMFTSCVLFDVFIEALSEELPEIVNDRSRGRKRERGPG